MRVLSQAGDDLLARLVFQWRPVMVHGLLPAHVGVGGILGGLQRVGVGDDGGVSRCAAAGISAVALRCALQQLREHSQLRPGIALAVLQHVRLHGGGGHRKQGVQ